MEQIIHTTVQIQNVKQKRMTGARSVVILPERSIAILQMNGKSVSHTANGSSFSWVNIQIVYWYSG